MAGHHLSLALWRFRDTVLARPPSLFSWLRPSCPPVGRESRNRQTDGSWPLDSRQKGPSNFQILCLCDGSSPSPVLPQPTLSLSLLLRPHTMQPSGPCRDVRTALLHECPGPPPRSGSCTALRGLITSLSCPHPGQPGLWPQTGQPTLLLWDRSWQASSMLGTRSLCPLPCPFCSSLGHGEQGKTTRERGRKAPAMPQGPGSTSHHHSKGCPRGS